MSYYDLGDAVRLGNYSESDADAFTNLAGEATDPSAVTLTIIDPDGDSRVYGWPSAGADGSLTREAAGRFYTDITFDIDGEWQFTLAGTGTVVAAASGRLYVHP